MTLDYLCPALDKISRRQLDVSVQDSRTTEPPAYVFGIGDVCVFQNKDGSTGSKSMEVSLLLWAAGRQQSGLSLTSQLSLGKDTHDTTLVTT
mmetsp:Transcript_8857/g.16222  ORF Transcript_8857/g.16222 Transcript_8857/m.16222 type:complete len:92 (-) Transcript_8857:329-604(-)